jgi:hypothetical protein
MANRRWSPAGFGGRIGLCRPAKPVQNLKSANTALANRGTILREGGQDIWWRNTGRLAAGTLTFCLAAAIVPVLIPDGSTLRLLGLPLGLFALTLAAPLGILSASFWFAGRQQACDDRYDATGN